MDRRSRIQSRVCAGDKIIGIVNLYMALKTMRPNEITKDVGTNRKKEVQG